MEDNVRPNALTHGIYPSSPANLSPVPIEEWKTSVEPVLKQYFKEEYDELVRRHNLLVQKYQTNQMVYNSEINFKPIIGHIYYLYEKPTGVRFLSLVAPENTFWTGFIGKYRLTAQFAWEAI